MRQLDAPSTGAAPSSGQLAPGMAEARSRFGVLDALDDRILVLSAIRSGANAIMDLRIEYANPAASRHLATTLGVPPALEAVLGRAMLDVRSVGDAGLDVQRRVIETGDPATGGTFQEASGRWYQNEYTRFGDGVVMVGRDITERRRAELALQESEDRSRAATEASRDGLWDWDVATGRIWYSRQWNAMLGQPDKEFVGGLEDWSSRLHPDDTATAMRALHEHLDGLTPTYAARIRVRHEDGHWVWILDRGSVIARDDAGSPLRMIGTHTDISALMTAEELLRISEGRYRALVEGVPGIVYSYSTTRGGIYYSPRAQEILGYSPEQLLASPTLWRDSVHPDDIAAVDAAIAVTVQETASQVVYRIRDAHGDWHWLEDCSTRFGARADEVVIEGFALDITSRKRAEAEREHLSAQLEQAQKLESIGRLAGGVAHDFNNMLGAIIGHADIALDSLEPASPIRADLEEIRSAANRSADLTRQLLAFARRQAVTPRVVNMNTTIAGEMSMLRRLIREGIALSWQPGDDVRPVRIDPSQVDQLLTNLCVNARDAIVGVGRIEISTANATPPEIARAAADGHPATDYVRLVVRDDGSGMEPGVLARIFEPFFTTRPVGQGTGLGLATVHGIASQNGGWVEVDSAPGAGSTFTVFLPAVAGLEPVAVEEAAAAPRGQGETILLVEDEPVILRLTTAMLTRLGYRVLAASTPGIARGLAVENSSEINLLISDVVMPEMNGQELVAALTEDLPGLPHLFMSGYTADVIAQHGVMGAGVHFLQKPFTAGQLNAAVRKVLDGV